MYAQTSRRGQGRARAYSKCFRTYLSEKASDPRHSIRQTFPRSLKMLESWIRSVVKGKLFNPLYFALYGSGTACCIWSLSAIVLIIRIVFFHRCRSVVLGCCFVGMVAFLVADDVSCPRANVSDFPSHGQSCHSNCLHQHSKGSSDISTIL